MKKLILTLMLLATAVAANAIIAPRTPYKVLQPDGKELTLINHGDEFHHWTSTVGGTVVELRSDGYWKPSRINAPSSESIARRAQAEQARTYAAENSISMGEKHFLVVLIEFNNLSFTLNDPKDAFERMLNEPGYSSNGGTGSVKDFYILNSSDKFIPTFDVYGPVKLSRDYAYYGRDDNTGNDSHPDEALYEACKLLDGEIDFSVYDHDGDGYVDNVFYYYAGYNQAEGASSNTIWPHAWILYRHNGTFDGVRVWSYACASEYKGVGGKRMCGIGTFTHEFAHVLGLPDFYDTDYESQGEAEGLGAFSTMDSGCYNNEGRTPPLFNAVERNILGWMDEPELLVMSGTYTLESIRNNKAYYTPTSNQGEIFIYEYRDGTGWDSYNAAGLVIYHLDKSSNIVGQYSASQRWESMYGINEVGDHPCFYVVPSSGYLWPTEYAVYPGALEITSAEHVAWSGEKTAYSLSDISHDQNAASFTVKASPLRTVRGTVVDSDGNPITGARIFGRYGTATSGAPDFGITTGFGGSYSLSLSIENGDGTFTITAMAPRFAPVSEYINVSYTPYTKLDFRLEPAEGNGTNALTMLGFNTLAEPGNVHAGDVLPLEIVVAPGNEPESVAWYFDDARVSDPSVTLSSGKHTIKAVQTFSDRTEELFFELKVD